MFQIEIQKYFYSNEHLLSISIAIVDIFTYKADFPGRLFDSSEHKIVLVLVHWIASFHFKGFLLQE